MLVKRTDMIVRTLSGERYTPFTLAHKLGAKGILESVSSTHGKDRYSLLLLQEAFRIVQEVDQVVLLVEGERVRCDSHDILEVVAAIASQNVLPQGGMPIPGAGIGYLGYRYCQRCDTITLAQQEDTIGIPESQFIVGHVYIVFDHFTDTLHLFGLNYQEHMIDLDAAIQQIMNRLEDLDFSYLAPPQKAQPVVVDTDLDRSHQQFISQVKTIKEDIVAGNLLQAVLSRRLVLRSDEQAMAVYRRLRSQNPSPYLFLLDFDDYQLVGASPESIVRVRDGIASIRPIAGTRRRGKNTAEDEQLKQELLEDPKELSEHLMLVDLARNDLGRVSVPGSVRVTRNMDVEYFSHVMHIVSDVVGQIDPVAYRPIDVLKSAFPAGTVSGAPKIAAIERLSELETEERSFYGGAVGYIEPDGDLDFCISIRCALKKQSAWILQAGAGIVYASTPEREWEETEEKLAVLQRVLTGGEHDHFTR